MALYAPTVANIILQMATNMERKLVPGEVHSLVYLSHGWSLAIKDSPLVRNQFIASENGIITEELSMVFKGHWNKDIIRNINCNLEPVSDSDLDTIEGCMNTYLYCDRKTIMDRPRESGTPWQLLHVKGGRITIPDAITKKYFVDNLKIKENIQ